ncbi:hypothetical protein PAMP_001008 [Pampus punctatissimus]
MTEIALKNVLILSDHLWFVLHSIMSKKSLVKQVIQLVGAVASTSGVVYHTGDVDSTAVPDEEAAPRLGTASNATVFANGTSGLFNRMTTIRQETVSMFKSSGLAGDTGDSAKLDLKSYEDKENEEDDESEMDYFHGNSRTRRRRIKNRVQQHLVTLAMEAVDQADQAVDQADQAVDQADQVVDQADQAVDQADQVVDRTDQVVDQADQAVDQADQVVDQADQAVDPNVQVEEYMENNADEAVNLQFDFDSADDDLYMCSDCEEDPACDFTEEEPHSDAKRKLAGQLTIRCLILHCQSYWQYLELGLDVPKDPRTLLGTVKDCEVAKGATSVDDATSRMMKYILSNKLALDYNMFGRHGKNRFKYLHLFSVVYEAFKKNTLMAQVNQQEAERALSKWFTGARDRGG